MAQGNALRAAPFRRHQPYVSPGSLMHQKGSAKAKVLIVRGRIPFCAFTFLKTGAA
jgi:hypothetical protein